MGNYLKILICLDLTEENLQVERRGRTLAASAGAGVTLLHVVQYVPVGAGRGPAAGRRDRR